MSMQGARRRIIIIKGEGALNSIQSILAPLPTLRAGGLKKNHAGIVW